MTAGKDTNNKPVDDGGRCDRVMYRQFAFSRSPNLQNATDQERLSGGVDDRLLQTIETVFDK